METKIFNANVLKTIAIVAMTLDHLAYAFGAANGVNTWIIMMRVFGRLTMPIMCFFIAEGYCHTRNWRKYLGRLFCFALLAHFAYVYLFSYQGPLSFIPFINGKWQSQTSVLWGLAWGLVLIRIYDSQWKLWLKLLATAVIIVITLPADWMCATPLLILAFWKNRGHFALQMLWLMLISVVLTTVQVIIEHSVLAMINFMVILCLPILWQYNGQRGRSPRVNAFLKWFFYLYYPLHLLVIGILFHNGIFVIG